jgi:segregation and condensation protein B
MSDDPMMPPDADEDAIYGAPPQDELEPGDGDVDGEGVTEGEGVASTPAQPPVSDTFRNMRLVEALLFASTQPLTVQALGQRLPEGTDIPSLLQTLKEHYANRGVTLAQVGESWAFRTAPDLASSLRMETTTGRKLSRAAVETLAIIAYHEPVTRAEVEEIRGVALSKGTLDLLFEAGWIRPKGRRKTPGRPVTWVTTEAFLDHFGLESREDLPGVEELKAAGLLDSRPVLYGARAHEDGQGPVDTDAVPGDDSEMPEPLETDAGADLPDLPATDPLAEDTSVLEAALEPLAIEPDQDDGEPLPFSAPLPPGPESEDEDPPRS